MGDRVPFTRALQLMSAGLVRVLGMEHNFDETIQVALTEKDMAFLAIALPSTVVVFPDADELSEELQYRILELVRAQHPEWLDEELS